MLGVIAQESGRYRLAIKLFARGIAADPLHGGCHYNLASCHQALDQRDEALVHFRQAILIGMTDRDVQERMTQNPVIGACLARIAQNWPVPIRNEELFGADGLVAIARDIFLQCALETIAISGWAAEAFLTQLRSALLHLAETSVRESRLVDDHFVACFCALAQQCFINEYVFAQRHEEALLAARWSEMLSARMTAGDEVPPLLPAAVAAYIPLHSLATPESLLRRDWPQSVARLLKQQIQEPLEEARDRAAIPALTTIDDGISRAVMQQYEENPYPRWTLSAIDLRAGEGKTPRAPPGGNARQTVKEILVADCGTGQHPIQVAKLFPEAQVLAVSAWQVSPTLGARPAKMACATSNTRRPTSSSSRQPAAASIASRPSVSCIIWRIRRPDGLHELAAAGRRNADRPLQRNCASSRCGGACVYHGARLPRDRRGHSNLPAGDDGHAFETANPRTFVKMDRFSVRKGVQHSVN